MFGDNIEYDQRRRNVISLKSYVFYNITKKQKRLVS